MGSIGLRISLRELTSIFWAKNARYLETSHTADKDRDQMDRVLEKEGEMRCVRD